MQREVTLSGFGGQGALFAGQLLAYAAMDLGYEVTWIPSYGPEMRGGTAHCTVVISDQPIGSPLVSHPACVVALNNPSAERYEPVVASGGVLVYNASLVSHVFTRRDVRLVPVAATEAAEALGSEKLLNVVAVGALLAAADLLPLDAVERALEAHLPAAHRGLLELNRRALRRGAEAVRARVGATLG